MTDKKNDFFTFDIEKVKIIRIMLLTKVKKSHIFKTVIVEVVKCLFVLM